MEHEDNDSSNSKNKGGVAIFLAMDKAKKDHEAEKNAPVDEFADKRVEMLRQSISILDAMIEKNEPVDPSDLAQLKD